MSKKYDVYNCSPKNITIFFGSRRLSPGGVSRCVPEKEINGAIRKLESAGHVKIVESGGRSKAPAEIKQIIKPEKKETPISAPITKEVEVMGFPWIETEKTPTEEPEKELIADVIEKPAKKRRSRKNKQKKEEE